MITSTQVFTPPYIVELILDTVDYKGNNILNKTILEPSFGEDAFLCVIVKRIILSAQSLSKKDISQLINDIVYGIEKDTKLYDVAIENLNNILADNDIPIPQWSNLISILKKLIQSDSCAKWCDLTGSPLKVNYVMLDKKTVANFGYWNA